MSPVLLVGTYLLTMALTLSLRPLAYATGLIDYPGGRKTHGNPTPMTGGLGIYLGLLSISILSPVLMAQYQVLLLLSGLVLIIGIVDDMYDIRASVRLVCHGTAALGMALFADVKLDTFGDLLFIGPIQLGILSLPLTAFATVGVINAVNMSDGLDGLSSGLVTIALGFLSLSAMVAHADSVLSFSQVLGVTLIAFLTLNFRMLWKKSALVYLGDAGSTLLGFMLAWLLIASTQGSSAFIPPVYALWFFAVPLIDTVSLLIRRPLQGKSPFSPGRDHLHHRLQRAGFTQQQTVLTLYGAAIALASVGFAAHLAGVSEGVMFLLFMTLFGGYMSVNQKNPLVKEAVSLGLRVVSDNTLTGGGSGAKPRHLAVIMDGNNRWAKQQGLRPKDGHRQGAIACRQLIKDCIALQIPYLTLFAFSSENWLRSKTEIRSLMALFRSIMARNEIADLHAAGAKIQFIGKRSNFSAILLAGMDEIEQRTANNTAITVTVALDYGGQWDITQAVQKYVEERRQGNDSASGQWDVDDLVRGLTEHLCTSSLPEPDLCIRTAGERRLSNFLLWQFAYTELYFSDAYWPDFTIKDLNAALKDYSKRERKYGQRSES
jgi:UDP-GlcNAc:undecaprenyl-phosphate/decaprenyl-phosphate GlcNAc-1-phosphate transferase